MKPANVKITIQLDIPDHITDRGEQVKFVLDAIDTANRLLTVSGLESQPQILSAGIDASDIEISETDSE